MLSLNLVQLGSVPAPIPLAGVKRGPGPSSGTPTGHLGAVVPVNVVKHDIAGVHHESRWLAVVPVAAVIAMGFCIEISKLLAGGEISDPDF